MDDSILTLADTASYLNVSQHTLRRWTNAGDFPAKLQLGARRVGWLRSDVEGWVAERATAARTAQAARA